MLAEAREQAIDRMLEEAESLGANAVISVLVFRLQWSNPAPPRCSATGRP